MSRMFSWSQAARLASRAFHLQASVRWASSWGDCLQQTRLGVDDGLAAAGGFSRQAIELLQGAKIQFATFDILGDEEVRLPLTSIPFLLSIQYFFLSCRVSNHLSTIYMKFPLFYFKSILSSIQFVDTRDDCSFLVG